MAAAFDFDFIAFRAMLSLRSATRGKRKKLVLSKKYKAFDLTANEVPEPPINPINVPGLVQSRGKFQVFLFVDCPNASHAPSRTKSSKALTAKCVPSRSVNHWVVIGKVHAASSSWFGMVYWNCCGDGTKIPDQSRHKRDVYRSSCRWRYIDGFWVGNLCGTSDMF